MLDAVPVVLFTSIVCSPEPSCRWKQLCIRGRTCGLLDGPPARLTTSHRTCFRSSSTFLPAVGWKNAVPLPSVCLSPATTCVVLIGTANNNLWYPSCETHPAAGDCSARNPWNRYLVDAANCTIALASAMKHVEMQACRYIACGVYTRFG